MPLSDGNDGAFDRYSQFVSSTGWTLVKGEMQHVLSSLQLCQTYDPLLPVDVVDGMMGQVRNQASSKVFEPFVLHIVTFIKLTCKLCDLFTLLLWILWIRHHGTFHLFRITFVHFLSGFRFGFCLCLCLGLGRGLGRGLGLALSLLLLPLAFYALVSCHLKIQWEPLFSFL